MSLLPWFLVMAELAQDPDGLESILLMVDSVESADDLWAWIEYLNLPEEGWVGTQVPPLALMETDTSESWLATLDSTSFLIPKAYAQSPRGKRVGVAKIKKLTRALKQLDNNLLQGSGRQLINGIKGVVESLKLPEAGSLRKMAFNPQVLTTSVALGGAAFRKIVQRTKNLRMSPMAIAAVVTYLESRRGGCNEVPAPCRPFNSDVARKIPALYKAAFLEVLVGERQRQIGFRENGALFHLAMIAVKHLEYEVRGDSALQIIDIESLRIVQLYTKASAGTIKRYRALGRRVDILLSGNGGETIGAGNKWVEVKSLKYTPNYKSNWRPWNMKGGKYSYHRQFYLDRVGSTTNGLPGWMESEAAAADYEWWLQSFRKAPSDRSYQSTEMNEVHKMLRELPKDSSAGASYSSLGYINKAQNDAVYLVTQVNSRVQLMNVKNWLISTAKNVILSGVDDDLIAELITNSDEF